MFLSPLLLPGVAEMLAMEMKSTGMYLSRGLSFKETEVRAVTFFSIYLCLIPSLFVSHRLNLHADRYVLRLTSFSVVLDLLTWLLTRAFVA